MAALAIGEPLPVTPRVVSKATVRDPALRPPTQTKWSAARPAESRRPQDPARRGCHGAIVIVCSGLSPGLYSRGRAATRPLLPAGALPKSTSRQASMGPVLAALGAAIAAVMEVTVASRIHVADAQPQIVLVIAILLTLVIGFEEGLAWAFVGGLFVDLLAFRPLGSTIFGLLVVVGLAAAISPILIRIRFASPLVGVMLPSTATGSRAARVQHGRGDAGKRPLRSPGGPCVHCRPQAVGAAGAPQLVRRRP